MTKDSGANVDTEQLLGEIETDLVGRRGREARAHEGEPIRLCPAAKDRRGRPVVRIENEHSQLLGYLPRPVSAWLVPLIDAGKVRVDGYADARVKIDRPSRRTRNPLRLAVYWCEQGTSLLDPGEINTMAEGLHDAVRHAYRQIQNLRNSQVIQQMARSLGRLSREGLLPETQLLLALMPAMAREVRVAEGLQAVARMHELLDQLTIGTPSHHRNLTVFPLSWPQVDEAPYQLIGPALEQGEAVIEEVDEDGDVPNLRVQNRSIMPLLIPEGAILIGAKQNRVVNLTVIVAPKSRFTLPVSCVEQGRWHYESHAFRSDYYAPPSIRSKKLRSVHASRATDGVAESDQGEVWAEVDACLHGAAAESETASLTDSFDAAEERLDAYRQRIELPDEAAGFLVVRGDCVLGMDLFDAPETLAELWPRLADAYFLDALRHGDDSEVSTKDVAVRFLDRVKDTAHMAPHSMGLGDELEISGEGLSGTAVLFEDRICHLVAFGDNQTFT